MQCRRFRSTVAYRYPDQDVFGRRLGVLDEHVEVAILVEDSRVEEFILEVVAASCLILANEVVIGIGAMRGLNRYFRYEWVGVASR